MEIVYGRDGKRFEGVGEGVMVKKSFLDTNSMSLKDSHPNGSQGQVFVKKKSKVVSVDVL
ncbi:hypothetical protein HPP92_016340 [Vanilla planifolia]|uniref:Uncharacterized protein n=1 Tax=Vanilla planifolia TaxID=51239 RepID=A0A835QAQ6_VANPL|nr:hypothetical protein HPP92_016340 [Vanilla planifolia]